VSLAWSKPDALDEAFRARVAAKALAANEIGDQAVRRRLLGAIRSALLAPELTTELESAVRSFSKGVDPSEREQRAAEIVYAARLELDEAAANDALAAETAALLDDEFDSFADALFTIDDDRYREITGDRLLDPDRFWGARARLDESVPEEVVLGALRDREQGNQLRVGDGGAVVRLLRQPLEFPIQLAAAADSGKASQVTRVGWHGSDVSAYARPEPGPHLRLRVLEPKDAATVELAGLIRPVQDGWARFEVDLLRALWETSELELTVTAQDGRVLRAAFDA
jgi:hypothetical protein